MKLGFLILAHDNPANTARLIRVLLESGSAVCLHYDLKGGEAPLKDIRDRLGDLADRLILAKRVRVSWGEWSIVDATLNGLAALFESGEELDYIHLMSGADYPLRPVSEFRNFLKRQHGVDFIESHAIASRQWVKGGLSRERYQYRHFFNFKTRPKLFNWCWKIQSALGLRKKPPSGLPVYMGSQWWTLTAATCKYVLERGRSPEVVRFFRRSWIPDEMFVQTLAAQTDRKHSNRHLTLYQFNDYGVPIVFYDSHADYLERQPFFFARKLSPFAGKLRDELDVIVRGVKPSRHFHDSEIGSLTGEYEQFKTLHRKGLPARRLPGQVSQGHWGELAWNTRRYLVLVGTSTFELQHAASLLRRIPDIVCHGFLFGPKKIEFAENAKAVAGYTHWSTQLRDHNHASFLSDIIKSCPGKFTCLLLRRQEAPSLLQDILRWDAHATVIFIEGGVLRSYMESSGRLTSTGPANEAGIENYTDIGGLVEFQRVLQGWSAGILPKQNVCLAPFQWIDASDSQSKQNAGVAPFQRVDASDPQSKQNACMASFQRIDAFDPQWPRQLIDAVVASGAEVRQAASILHAHRTENMRPSPVDIPLAAGFLSLGHDTVNRRKVITEILAPVKPPYLAVISPSLVTARGVAAQMAACGCFSLPEDQPQSVADLIRATIAPGVEKRRDPVVFACGADDISLIEALSLDPDARILAIGSLAEEGLAPERNVIEFSSQSTGAEMRQAWEDVVTHLKDAAGPVMVLSGRHGHWASVAASFAASNFPILSGKAAMIAQGLTRYQDAGTLEEHSANDFS